MPEWYGLVVMRRNARTGDGVLKSERATNNNNRNKQVRTEA